ncbi:MAG: hypothetical protein KKA84_05870 [Bacteroidetes bacterium]|nr:hypothetical protein [Bacteroidota bacterium]
MNKPRFWILILPFFLLTACINYQQITVLKKDGSGEMFIHYWMQWKSAQDSITISNMEIFQIDSVNAEFSTSFSQIEDVEVYEQKSDSSFHTKVELTFEKIDSLNSTEIFNLSKFSLIDGPNETKIFSQFVPPLATGFGLDKSPKQMEYVYYLPGKVLKHNADEIDKNKLTWLFSSDKIGTGKFLSATITPFRLKETPMWVYYSAFFVIAVVLYFLFSKRK